MVAVGLTHDMMNIANTPIQSSNLTGLNIPHGESRTRAKVPDVRGQETSDFCKVCSLNNMHARLVKFNKTHRILLRVTSS